MRCEEDGPGSKPEEREEGWKVGWGEGWLLRCETFRWYTSLPTHTSLPWCGCGQPILELHAATTATTVAFSHSYTQCDLTDIILPKSHVKKLSLSNGVENKCRARDWTHNFGCDLQIILWQLRQGVCPSGSQHFMS
jgi:hypothetical protein